MHESLAEILSYWGKSGRPGDSHGYHPACYHLLDVAACAEAVLRIERFRLERLSGLLAVDPDALASMLVFLVGLHDLGKFSRSFQAKIPDLWPDALGRESPRPPDTPHGAITFRLLTDQDKGLAKELGGLFPGVAKSAVKRLLGAVAGHHGEPIDEHFRFDWNISIGRGSEAARAAFVGLRQVLEPAPLPQIGEAEAPILSWALAGLCVLSDWLGSNKDCFGVRPPNFDLATYWNDVARPSAKKAVAHAGLGPCAPSAGGIRDLFPDISDPSPIQAFAAESPLPDGPVLAVIEDATGAGKTEAAIVLAHRLMRARNHAGVFFALPTMATANAMYGRLAKAYRGLFAPDAAPSLVLAHGRRDLHPDFAGVSVASGLPDRSDGEETAEQACADWIADDRRKAFLAHVGAGTIDQALLAILPSRHQSLRLWGLADRILVVDEAHAYDAYMMAELKALLEFQAALGGSAVVLSATLPKAMRDDLAKAFRRGLGFRDRMAVQDLSYPLATLVSAEGVTEHPTALRPGLAREIAVQLESAVTAAWAAVIDAAAAGGAVAVIRNTVDEAIETAETLSALTDVPVILFHARFAMCDRLDIEDAVLRRFGKAGDPQYPRNAILVATQVVEQSLDLDFDLIVSDLAPVDLLIQRAGRLWRHLDRRPPASRPVPGPHLVVISARASAESDVHWLEAVLPRTGAVYRNPAVLWRTAMVLDQARRIRIAAAGPEAPATVRHLVQAVYEDAHVRLPTALEIPADHAEGRELGASALARQTALEVATGYVRNQAWASDVDVATRIGEETTTFRLAQLRDGEIVPWASRSGSFEHRGWALSEVSVRRARATGDMNRPELGDLLARVKAAWPRFERAIPILVLDGKEDSGFSGQVARNDEIVPVTYDRSVGLGFG